MSDVTSLQNKHCNPSMLCVCIITYQLVIGMKISSSLSRNDAVSCSHRFSRGLRRIHPDFGAFIIDDLVTYLFFLQAHTSSVSHLDWSKDGENLQSTSTDYELLFCKGKLYFHPV